MQLLLTQGFLLSVGGSFLYWSVSGQQYPTGSDVEQLTPPVIAGPSRPTCGNGLIGAKDWPSASCSQGRVRLCSFLSNPAPGYTLTAEGCTQVSVDLCS